MNQLNFDENVVKRGAEAAKRISVGRMQHVIVDLKVGVAGSVILLLV